MSQRKQNRRRPAARTAILWLSTLTLLSIIAHNALLIFAMVVIDLCALAGWYA